MMRRIRPGRSRAPATAFVLSGGGNAAVAQVGMLRALVERELVPDVVVGTSAGALNGAALAAAPTIDGVDQLAVTWLGLRTEDVFPGGRLARAWNILRRDSHLFESNGLADVIERSVDADDFADLVIPLRVVAADLRSGDEVVLAAGPLRPALLASASLPGVFPPVEHAGRLLTDGAVVNTVPLWHALAGAPSRVFVLDVSGGDLERPLRSPLDTVLRAFAIARAQRFDVEIRHAPPDVDVIVLPCPPDDREPLDFSGAEALLEESHGLAAHCLDEWARPRGRRRR